MFANKPAIQNVMRPVHSQSVSFTAFTVEGYVHSYSPSYSSDVSGEKKNTLQMDLD